MFCSVLLNTKIEVSLVNGTTCEATFQGVWICFHVHFSHFSKVDHLCDFLFFPYSRKRFQKGNYTLREESAISISKDSCSAQHLCFCFVCKFAKDGIRNSGDDFHIRPGDDLDQEMTFI